MLSTADMHQVRSSPVSWSSELIPPDSRKPKPELIGGPPGGCRGLLCGMSCQLNGSVTSHSRGPVCVMVGGLARTVPELGPHHARDLVTVTSALAAMLWQYTHPPPALEQLYRDDPRLGHTILDFQAHLSRMIRYTVTGMTTPVSGSR